MSVTKDQAAALYAAVFNRAPDQNGLNFWTAQDNFVAMSEGFVTHPVFTEQYGELSNEEFVKAIYENVLQGQGDAEGIEFWVNALDNGVSRGEFLAEFIDAALAYDGDDADALLRKAALENKVTVGLYYTEKMGAASNLSPDVDPSSADVVNDPAYKAAAAAIANVTADPATVEAAKAEIDASVPVDRDDLVEAVGVYQAGLDQQEAAEKAQAEAAKAAVEGLGLTVSEGETVADVLAQEVDSREDTALKRGFGLEDNEKAPSLSLNDATVALIRESLANDIKTAQTKVDLLKAQNASAVALQEKIEAYNSVAKEINKTVLDFNGEAAKFGVLNEEEGKPTLSAANSKADFAVTIGEGAEAITLKVIKGEVVAAEKKNVGTEEAPKEVWVKDADADAKFNKLAGAAALKAETLAVYNNIAKQEAAQKAIETATIQALKDAGYKVYDEAGEKVVSWANVKFENGALVAAKDESEETFQILDSKKENDIFEKDLVTIPSIDEEGTLVGKAELGEDTNLPESVTADAADSEQAVVDLQDAKDASKDFEEALTKYNEAAELQKALTDATADVTAAEKVVADAEKAFEKLGVNLVKADEAGVATGEVFNEDNADELTDLFVYSEALTKVENFEGPDLLYFGDKAAALIVLGEDTDLTKGKLGGDANVLEIFAIQDGADTVLYVEKAAFAGNSTNDVTESEDFVAITLTGVKADDLGLDADGFLSFA